MEPRKPIRPERLYLVLLTFPVLVLGLLMWESFKPSGDIKALESWVDFASVYNGILTPIISFTAFVALLTSITIQIADLRRSEKNQNEQISLLIAEQKRNDSNRVIESIIRRVDEIIDTPITEMSKRKDNSIRKAVSGNNDLDTGLTAYPDIISEYKRVYTQTRFLFENLENSLLLLKKNLVEYETISENNGLEVTALTRYYRSEFSELIAPYALVSLLNDEVTKYFCSKHSLDSARSRLKNQ